MGEYVHTFSLILKRFNRTQMLLPEDAFHKGCRIQLGDSAQIEFTMLREPCEWFELVQNKTMAETEGRVGMMALVIAGGEVKVGDPVTVLQVETV